MALAGKQRGNPIASLLFRDRLDESLGLKTAQKVPRSLSGSSACRPQPRRCPNLLIGHEAQGFALCLPRRQRTTGSPRARLIRSGAVFAPSKHSLRIREIDFNPREVCS